MQGCQFSDLKFSLILDFFRTKNVFFRFSLAVASKADTHPSPVRMKFILWISYFKNVKVKSKLCLIGSNHPNIMDGKPINLIM